MSSSASADQGVGQPERLEHLHRAASDAVGLPDLQRSFAALDHPRGDVGERRELRREHRARRARSDDEHVDRVGEVRRAHRDRGVGGLDVGVTGAVSVAVELYGISFDRLIAPGHVRIRWGANDYTACRVRS